MRCIFCKRDSASSRSVEHIIPEALGNTEHVLPRGVVCDVCNNYFTRKLEAPLLASPLFLHARSRQHVTNKRGRVPPMRGLVPAVPMIADVWLDGLRLVLGGQNQKQLAQLEAAILEGRASKVYLPLPTVTNARLLERFMAKVGLEVVAARSLDVPNWQDEILGSQLDALRRFARIGDQPKEWPISRRNLYDENDVQVEGNLGYQVLHEYTLLYTPGRELYAVVCIFGEEFAINLGGPKIDGYRRWLEGHQGRSPLYTNDTLPISPDTLPE